jgi:hypothetical protein
LTQNSTFSILDLKNTGVYVSSPLSKGVIFVMIYLQETKRRQKLVFGVFFSISLVSLCLATGWAQQARGPKMVLPEKLYNAQEVEEGDVVAHDFPVLNQGDQPLEIKRVQPG